MFVTPSSDDVHPFSGFIETTADALRLVQAARQGVIPRITRRLNDFERRSMIRSGSVFVFNVEESGMKRWTEGLAWSPSRMSGNFLVYREVTERGSTRTGQRKPYGDASASDAGHHANDQDAYKPGGLIKKTITVNIDGTDYHLISYYTQEDISSGRLQRPLSRQDIMAMDRSFEADQLKSSRNPLKFTTGSDGKLRLLRDGHDPNDRRRRASDVRATSPTPSGWTPSREISVDTGAVPTPRAVPSWPYGTSGANVPTLPSVSSHSIASSSSSHRVSESPSSFPAQRHWMHRGSKGDLHAGSPHSPSESRHTSRSSHGAPDFAYQSYHLTPSPSTPSSGYHSPHTPYPPPNADGIYPSHHTSATSPTSPSSSSWSWSSSSNSSNNQLPYPIPTSHQHTQQVAPLAQYDGTSYQTSDQYAGFNGYQRR
ncbi:hypothetical protein JAAARDRAFT_33862 [Jaapia argillacea MUCL 33604]|uniref:Uncharacterized protein n=1 Tax=Jaapia argillacea MUCL 33604 TaxID=933084 RepID=A0A067PZ04_9AGAM|nr:hypothetical protein JAAARDRAFT_33862 [Jaapia argillacea MUCL 33604]